jgi:hypothetical protein
LYQFTRIFKVSLLAPIFIRAGRDLEGSKAGKSNFFEGQNLTKQTVFYPTFPRLWIIVKSLFYNNLLALGGLNFRLLSIIKEEPENGYVSITP